MKEIYAWVPWFRELARKIADGGEAYLIERAKRVDWEPTTSEPDSVPPLLNYGDENIDPFSFFYFLAQKETVNQRKPVYTSVSKVFEIDAKDILSEKSKKYGLIFPRPQSNANALFHYNRQGKPDLLWKLFRQAINNDVNFKSEDFKSALDITMVDVIKLTECLFLINPNYFIPVDKTTFEFYDALHLPSLDEARNEIRKQNGWGYYKGIINKFHTAFPECYPYEINTALYQIGRWKKEKNTIRKNFFQVSTNVFGDGIDYWNDFLENNYVFTGGPGSGGWDAYKPNQPTAQGQKNYPLTDPKIGDIILVRYGNNTGHAVGIVYENDYGNELSDQSEVNKEMRIHVLWLNKNHTDQLGLGGQIPGFYDAHKYGVYEKFQNNEHYKTTFALIKKIGGDINSNIENNGRYIQMKSTALNQILYGPPGTGKTWNTINHALAIIEEKPVEVFEEECRADNGNGRETVKKRFDELKEIGQIEMVTFHQSFTYEDFIEGIKPVLGNDSDKVHFEIIDGVFKEISAIAKKNIEYDSGAEFDVDDFLQDFAEFIDDEIENHQLKLHKGPSKSQGVISQVKRSQNGKFQSFLIRFGGSDQTLTKKIFQRDYLRFYKKGITSHNDIRPVQPSERGHHGNARHYLAMMEHMQEFHKNWEPTEFLERIRKNYVLIIDEINRGNIAKIFGELITLLEPTKRFDEVDTAIVTLPYSKDEFSVPNNLYIIGTMNTADRSIALLDTALRRRFDFIEMMPEPEHPLISEDVEGVNCQELLRKMNKRITVLLDREHQIGHSYFIDVDSMEKLALVFQNKIIPLLQEYFYDDWKKIKLVLNENKFVTDDDIEENLFSDTGLINANHSIYGLIPANSNEWTKPANYQKIYGGKQTQEDDHDDD